MPALLEVRNLTVEFASVQGSATAVREVSGQVGKKASRGAAALAMTQTPLGTAQENPSPAQRPRLRDQIRVPFPYLA